MRRPVSSPARSPVYPATSTSALNRGWIVSASIAICLGGEVAAFRLLHAGECDVA
jgi:hypothetical protein